MKLILEDYTKIIPYEDAVLTQDPEGFINILIHHTRYITTHYRIHIDEWRPTPQTDITITKPKQT